MFGCGKEKDKTQNYLNAIINEISENTIDVTLVDNKNSNADKSVINAKSIIINSNTV